MPFYYYIFLVVFSLIIFLVIFSLISLKKSTSDLLFIKGLKQENLGHLHEAIIIYEEVLMRISKFKFQENFKHKIISKIKVLHTIIEYEAAFRTKN